MNQMNSERNKLIFTAGKNPGLLGLGSLFCLLMIFFLSTTAIKAQTDWLIPDSVSKVDGNDNYSSVKPGDRLLIPATRTSHIYFFNLKGEADNRITIINSSGQVRIDADQHWTAIWLRYCDYIRLTGTGDSLAEYGFDISNGAQWAVASHNTSHVEIDHLKMHDNGHSIHVNADYQFPRLVIEDTYIHHTYNYNTDYSAFYLGPNNDDLAGTPGINGLEVSYNHIEDAGWSGIKVKSAVDNVRVHHNKIINIGFNPIPGGNGGDLRFGIVIQKKPGGKGGDYYNNLIINSRDHGIYNWSYGGTNIYNNIIVDSGWDGIRWELGGTGGLVYNNTIIDSGQSGVEISSSVEGQLFNNIIAGFVDDPIESRSTDVSSYNNFIKKSVDLVGFADPDNNDFHLLSSSSAVDTGNETEYPSFDFDDQPRPQGDQSDIGADEYYSDSPIPAPISIPGDINHDGVVDISDLVLVGASFGTTNVQADANLDGTVNIVDLVLVGANFGNSF